MYSGTTFHKNSGGFIGVHQKIDRIARRSLAKQPGVGPGFPAIKDILHFEGNNGPDGVKRKSPSIDEPWHYIDPLNSDDRQLVEIINDHYGNLVEALRSKNDARAAFETAWIAHAITDGLTPAHHFPLSDKIEELWGKPKEERLSILDKNVIRHESKRQMVSKNWEYWGAKGVFLTHVMFEFGVAASIKTARFPGPLVTQKWLEAAKQKGHEQVFLDAMHEIFAMNMYERYWKQGWNAKLARETRQILIPQICSVVMFAWYSAYCEAGL